MCVCERERERDSAHVHMCVWASGSCDPMDCSPPRSSVHGISQARIVEWAAIFSSRGSFDPRLEPKFAASPGLSGGFSTTSTIWEAMDVYSSLGSIHLYLWLLFPKENQRQASSSRFLEEMTVQIKWDHVFSPFPSAQTTSLQRRFSLPSAKCRWQDVPERGDKPEGPKSKAMRVLQEVPGPGCPRRGRWPLQGAVRSLG